MMRLYENGFEYIPWLSKESKESLCGEKSRCILKQYADVIDVIKIQSRLLAEQQAAALFDPEHYFPPFRIIRDKLYSMHLLKAIEDKVIDLYEQYCCGQRYDFFLGCRVFIDFLLQHNIVSERVRLKKQKISDQNFQYILGIATKN